MNKKECRGTKEMHDIDCEISKILSKLIKVWKEENSEKNDKLLLSAIDKTKECKKNSKLFDTTVYVSSVAMLASEIEKEMAQPLNTIKLLTANMIDRAEVEPDYIPEEVLENIEHISVQVDRLEELANRLDMFWEINQRNGKIINRIDISESVKIILGFISRHLKIHGIEMITEIDEGLKIDCSLANFEQIVINLIINSIQFLDESYQEYKEIRIQADRDDHGEVIFRIYDNGPGINKNSEKHLFDLFYNTKQIKQGKDFRLRLAIVKYISNKIGAELRVIKQAIRGTCIEIRFSRSENEIINS